VTREIKENELLSTQYKIDSLKKNARFFKRNWVNTIIFGALITILGPFYVSDPDIRGQTRTALEISDKSYLELSIAVAIFYTVAIIIANYVWTKQDIKKLKALEEREKIVKMELELFYK
jgi:hypothetical protein